MIHLKANDVKDLSFTLMQVAADSDPDNIILRTINGVRWKAWDLTGCVVAAILKRNNQVSPVIVSPSIVTPTTGVVTVTVGTQVTAYTFADGEQHVDASLEFQVTTGGGGVESVPKDGYIALRIHRDLDGA